MASGDKTEEAGRRLARDLREIRKANSVTTEAITRATKAAPTVIKEFEQTALQGNPMYNRVYLRLFIRGYAEVIGVRPEDALGAMDEVISGRYEGGLAKLYLEEEEAPAAGPEEIAQAAEGQKAKPPGGAEVDSGQPAAPEAVAGAQSDSSKRGAPPSQDVGLQKARSIQGDRPKSVRVADLAEASARRSAPTRRPRERVLLPGGGKLVRWVVAILGATAVILTAWLLWPEKAPDPPRVLLPADTLSSRLPPIPPRLVLPDTASFWVVAARDTLNPIRVTTDDGTRTPYWIEFEDSLEFRVASHLVIERRLEAIDVAVRGIRLPTTGRDELGRLRLSKEQAQAIFDSLRTVGGLPDA